MRRAAPALLLVVLFGCQSPPPPVPTLANIQGVWLRNDEEFVSGVSETGSSTSYEEFSAKGGYYAVDHGFNDRFESYTITKGTWHAFEGVLTLRYSERIRIGIKPGKTAEKERLDDVVELKPTRIEKDFLEYEHPTRGKITLVRGPYPADVEAKYRYASGEEFAWIGIDRAEYEKQHKKSN